MKKLFLIHDTVENKISFYYLASFMVSLPFHRLYSTLILFGFILHTLIFIQQKKLNNLKYNFIILQSVLIISIISGVYANSYSTALNTISKQLAIGMFPFFLFISNLNLVHYRHKLLNIFAIACTCIVIYLFMDVWQVINLNGMPLKAIFSSAFINHNFSMPIELHATYFSMFLVLSIVHLLQIVLHERSRVKMWLLMACLIVLLAGLLQLSSKAVLLAFGVIVLLGFPWLLLKKRKRIRFVVISCFLFLLGIMLTRNVQVFRERIWEGFKNDLVKAPETENMNWRIYRWEVATGLIGKSPLIGHGTGSELPELKSIYFERKLYGAYLNALNVHNQYLSFLINSGAWGLMVYLATLFWGFWLSIKFRDLLLFSFMILVSVTCFSENIFDVNKGIFFYAFFFSFLVFSISKLAPVIQQQGNPKAHLP